MGPDEPKGEVPPREAAEQEERSVREEVGREDAPRRGGAKDIDDREEEGRSQPESSAQKGPESPQEP